MTTRRPYLIRAFNDWILDNGLTPYLSVNADYDGVEVPRDFVMDGEIVLNISPASVRNLELGQEYILFDARFSGRGYQIVIPIKAVIAIFARENGEGMAFLYEKPGPAVDLRTQEMILKSIVAEEAEGDGDGDEPDDPPPKPPAGRPSLKVVK
ncbi:MAG: ClpXP protease specificity-enhancing factor [Gammaproteobacteria bacterium]|nr:ClpXP protease specificity-enhancing factor [Gammaproteobacteria bacterium]